MNCRIIGLSGLALLTIAVSDLCAADRTGHLALGDVLITEIMYHPPDEGAIQGDEYEFIELKNTGASEVDLSGVSFDDGIDYVFPAASIVEPGGFVVLASNAARFQEKYGFAPFGTYTGALSNSGERVALAAPGGAVFFEVTYSDDPPWPGAADGGGFSLVPLNPDSNPDPNDAANWRPSAEMGGSPGADDSPRDIPPVYVNELLAHTDPPQQDAVELYNPNDQTVNIGGWYLTDDNNEPRKYRLPVGTTIPPGGYLILDEEDFNPNPGVSPSFSFSAEGEEVYLYSADDAGNLTGYRHGYSFGASENQVSFGRHVNSVGAEQFLRQRASSFGQENVGPRPSPIVISEIMYHPRDGDDEFVEIANITNGLIPLYDPLAPENTWKLDGLTYVFPQGIELAAGEALLVVGIGPETFRSRYGISAEVQIVGPYVEVLSNASATLQLLKPDPPNADGSVPYIAMDAVTYSDDPPWPTAADGDGPSLQRTHLDVYADDPIYWQASPNIGGSPGNLSITSVEPGAREELARSFELEAAYPNPFNPTTRLNFTVRQTQDVRVELCDAVGRTLRLLYSGVAVAGADQSVTVHANDLPSGTYFVRLTGADFATSRAITLVK